MGADDYVVRPYAVEELVARVRRSVDRAKSARRVHTGFIAPTQ